MDDDIDETALLIARLEALAAFETAMVEAQRILEAARADPAAQRTAGINALQAVLTMMDGCDISLRAAGPLKLLWGALDGLNNGASPRLFDPPERRTGSPATTEHEWAQRAIAAAAYELRCRELGRGRFAEAAVWVARRTQHWDIWPQSSSALTQATQRRNLKEWRAAANKLPRGKAGREVYAYCTDPAHSLTAEAVLTRESSVWGIPGAPAPKDG